MVNVVTTSDNAVAEQLVVDPRVDLISFTGSTAVGRHIMAKGAPTMKRFFLELGGKSAQIVLDDVEDLDGAVGRRRLRGRPRRPGLRHAHPPARAPGPLRRGRRGRRRHDARSCPTATRTDPGNLQGPQISAKQRERVLGYIEKGVDEGARLVMGGGRPEHLEKGWFVEPTLFADVTNDMTIAREEIFGPVLVVIPYDDDDDAVRIANDNEYGLSGGVTAGSEERAVAVGQAPPRRHRRRQRRHLLRRRLALRRLQGQRLRPPERPRGLRAVPRDQGPRRSGPGRSGCPRGGGGFLST